MWPAIVPLAVLAAGAVVLTKAAKAKRAHAPLSQLAGSEWSPENNSAQFIGFKSGGELAGFGGCNNVFGNYVIEGQRLTIGPLAMTKKFCPEVMDDERAFIKILERAHSFKATHLRLVIQDADENTILVLKRRDWD